VFALWPLEHFHSFVTAVAAVSPGWREWATAAFDLLFPPLCPLCHRRLDEGRRDPLCGPCWAHLPRLAPPFCARCGRPFWRFESHRPEPPTDGVSGPASVGENENSAGLEPGLCEACWRQPPPFAYARAAALYRDAIREALHAFKFGGKTSLSRPLGDLLAEAGQTMLAHQSVDCLVPVPLHPARQAERGFNQSLLLARRLSQRWGLTVSEGALRRVRVTQSQTDLSAEERRANVRGAFDVRRARGVAGARVLLIDDIFTTGATVSECCRVLLAEGGASSVGVLTVARVP